MTDFDYCEDCRERPPEVVLYHVRVRGGYEFTMCGRCRILHGAELLR